GEQRALGTLVERFTSHDQPGAVGPVREVNEPGELGDRGAFALFAVLGERWAPGVVVEADPADRRMNVLVAAGHDAEADVALPAPVNEVCAAGRVGPHPHPASHLAFIVTGPMTDSGLLWQPDNGLVEDLDVIGDGVRASVARPQLHANTLPGGIGEAVQRMEPEPALVV